jgi:V-type H+-transporting ATPase subunit H
LIGKDSFNEVLINLGAVKIVRNMLMNKAVADDDALADLEVISKTLEHDLSTMSTFEIYQKEVAAGKLHWTQVHTEKFWRENVLKAEDNEFAIIRSLINLLDSDSIETVAIACYDLGEFARFYPGGKK